MGCAPRAAAAADSTSLNDSGVSSCRDAISPCSNVSVSVDVSLSYSSLKLAYTPLAVAGEPTATGCMLLHMTISAQV